MCLCMFVYVCMHPGIRMFVYVFFMYAHIVCVFIHVYVCTQVFVCVCVHVHMCIQVFVYVSMYVYVCIRITKCVYVCVLYVHMHASRYA
jgi:hypothetical protein